MGIKGLLQFVDKACREANIIEFRGCSVAVDVSCLLHKGLFGSMEEFANGKDSKFYLAYVRKHIKALLDLDCHVIMVFDGRSLPAKKDINDGRKQKREKNMQAGMILMTEGRKEEAVSKFQQAVTLTPEIVENTIEAFRNTPNVDIIVAPYESDAQLAYLTKQGFADAVITEDSDLIAFGCEKILFKWNAEKGSCQLYEKSLLPSCFTGDMRSSFDFIKFRRICILSGCDYLQNGLPGVGLNKALKFFNKTSQTDLRQSLPRIPAYLQDAKLKLPKNFIDEFIRAENTFLYQVVFDPNERCQKPLNPYPPLQVTVEADDDDDFVKPLNKAAAARGELQYAYAGVVLASKMAVRLALGNQVSDGAINDSFLMPKTIPEWSIWGDTFVSGGRRKAKLEEEDKRKRKSCGAFQLDSPQKKRKRAVETDEQEVLVIDDSPEKKKDSSPPAKKTILRAKKILNEPRFAASVDDIMRMYCGEEKGTETTGGSTAEDKENLADDAITVVEEESITLSLTTNSSTLATPQEPATSTSAVPALAKSSSLKKSLGAGKPSLGKSPYFSGKSPSVSNPFKRPEIVRPSLSSSSPATLKVEEKSNSLFDGCEEDDGKPVPAVLNRFSGFKPAGLRRSLTK